MLVCLEIKFSASEPAAFLLLGFLFFSLLFKFVNDFLDIFYVLFAVAYAGRVADAYYYYFVPFLRSFNSFFYEFMNLWQRLVDFFGHRQYSLGHADLDYN